ncbi:DUF937 domain-containing protein [Xanthobacter dioxanivorans]|uniref:DUF937 domain-containing protein n=1 Tax=Xanthobacter dioxanivorans TaxID=2528964 RepID=A0A974PMP2_9HYPH|nr:DUF937 domain-containing protein [Xanthobacter dioxanivorans]QRG06016.1 DUF937 domain-containing protein [Xanthobacter dioxanivorans]
MDQFVEMLRAAQGGQAIENIARMYGLSGQQAQMLTEAVMPAFAEAFKQASQSPEALASLMALMTSGPYGAFYSQAAAPAELSRAGTAALDTVFGSSEVSRAVAAQAAASTGLGIAMVRQTMPTLATLVVGGLAKSLAASGAIQTMLAAMLSRMPGQTEQRVAPISSGNPWIDAFLAFTSTAVETAPRPAPSTGNPWADAYAQMMFQRAAPPPAPAPARTPTNAWQDVVNAMATTMTQAGMPATKAPPPEPPPPPLLPFQQFFAQLFAQGFPPAFPGVATEGARPTYSVPEFWMDMMKAGTPRDVQEAETLPPEKPRLVKPMGDTKDAPRGSGKPPASGREGR